MVGGTLFSSNSQLMERSYSGLGAHFQIKITITFYKMDFSGTQQLSVTVDNAVSSGTQTTSAAANVGSNQCGGAGNEGSSTTTITFPHVADTAKITIKANSNAFSSWGVSNYNFEIDECDTNCYRCSGAATTCTSCKSGNYLNSVTNACATSCPGGKAGFFLKQIFIYRTIKSLVKSKAYLLSKEIK